VKNTRRNATNRRKKKTQQQKKETARPMTTKLAIQTSNADTRTLPISPTKREEKNTREKKKRNAIHKTHRVCKKTKR
jgi:hypothetical protein